MTVFYGGHRGPDIAETWGTSKLGAENMGPVVTRGIMLDILALKLDQGATADMSTTTNGKPLLVDNYRITVEDIEAAMRRQRIRSRGRRGRCPLPDRLEPADQPQGSDRS